MYVQRYYIDFPACLYLIVSLKGAVRLCSFQRLREGKERGRNTHPERERERERDRVREEKERGRNTYIPRFHASSTITLQSLPNGQAKLRIIRYASDEA
jgi:hypothetical protein